MNYDNKEFWIMLKRLVSDSEIVVDRPKGSRHPKYSDILYEVDYGYIKNTASMDGGGIDVWRGTDERQEIDAIMCTGDLVKKDSEIKVLSGCTDREKELIYEFHNSFSLMKGVLIPRVRK